MWRGGCAWFICFLLLLLPFPSATQEYWSTSDVTRGWRYFGRCAACHTVEKGGRHKVGPNLFGIIGRQAGTVPGYTRYSEGMKNSGVVWDYYTLDAYLGNSKMFIPDNLMACGRLNDPQERADIIRYLSTFTAQPAQ